TIQISGKTPLSKQQWILSLVVVVDFVLATLQIIGAIQRTMEFISFTCLSSLSSVQPNLLENICFVLTAWAVDVVMIWRFLYIYHDLKRTKWSIFVFASLNQMVSFGLGSLTVFILATQRDDFTTLLVFEMMTLIQNLALTTLIVGRLLLFRRMMQKVLGRSYGNEYTGVATMLLESQALLGVGQVTLLVTLSLQSNYRMTFYHIVGQLQVLTPLMLIYRVAQGKVYNLNTITQLTQIRFNNDNVPEFEAEAPV
ncbi:hypothetical protein BDQ17DRAFT_1528370, partial [Cyathus striatus]